MRTILLHIFDDEELLTRSDQAEFAAGDLLDRLRILSKLPRLFAELLVLDASACQRRFKGLVLLACLQHREEAAVPDQGVDDEDAADGDDQITDNSPPPSPGSVEVVVLASLGRFFTRSVAE
jgi:hypothetical protein